MRLHSTERLRAFVGEGDGCKMSQRQLARYIGKHPSFVNHLTSGRRKSCEPRTAELIAEALGVPLEIIFMPETPSNAMASAKSQVA